MYEKAIWRRCQHLTLALSLASATLAQATPPTPGAEPFRDPSLPIEQRVDNLISILTLDEKIALLGSSSVVPSHNIHAGTVEGIHGLNLWGPSRNGRGKPVYTTIFPQGYGLGETWDPAAVQLVGKVIGEEGRYFYNNTPPGRFGGPLVVMTPNADLGRDPRWGRTEECYGEDAFLGGTLVTSMVHGLQGDNPKYWQVASLLKHFLANSNEDTRDSSSSDFDERLWREYYSAPFRMGIIEGGARAFMAAYNSYNGIPCGANPMLRDITVNEWGENGVICTDGGAVRQMVTDHHYYPDITTAAAGTLKLGITKYLENIRPAILDALSKKLITEDDINQAIRGNIRMLIWLGALDDPSLVPYNEPTEPNPVGSDAHKAAALKVTQESIVLLKNKHNLLPLDRKSVKSIVVIGPHAKEVLLDWYSGQPAYMVSPFDGISAAVGPNTSVSFADGKDIPAAAAAAKAADVAILCLGNNPLSGQQIGWGKTDSPNEAREAVDRKAIDLRPEQEALAQAVQGANPRTVLVLISSFPVAINWEQRHINAILHMTHCSQEEGSALASVLFGDYNPGGRTVQTWPKDIGQLPPMLDYNIRHGRTYMYFNGRPLYPFGYGLSYTSFKWANLRTDTDVVPATGTVSVQVDVTNTGSSAGDDVVELYAHHQNSHVDRPRIQLVGFQRISLQPGETRTVTLKLPASRLAYWDVAGHQWSVEADCVQLLAGPSAGSLKMRHTIQIGAGTLPANASPDALAQSNS